MHIKQLAGYSKMYTFAFLCHSVKDGSFMNLLPPHPAPLLPLVYSYQSGTVWLLIPAAALTAFPIETQPSAMHMNTKLYGILSRILGSVGVWGRAAPISLSSIPKKKK